MKVPHVEILVNEADPENDIKNVIAAFKPEWKTEEIQFKTSKKEATAGLLNTMIKCYTHPKPLDAIMIRVYGSPKIAEYLNRINEVKNIKLIHDLYGFAPQLLATFTNGFCYKYICGEIMTRETVRLPKNAKIIAKQLALLHSTKIEEDFQLPSIINKYLLSVLPFGYPESLKKPEDDVRFQKYLPKKAFVEVECKRVIDRVKEFNLETVLSHNDMRSENIVWNKETGLITFVDWECAGTSPLPADIAYHFWRYSGIEDMDLSMYPDKDFQMEWLRTYLETYYSQTKSDENKNVSDIDVERLYVQVNTYYLLNLIQGVASVGFTDDMDDFPLDLIEIGRKSYIEYLKLRDSILSLKMP
uniref:ethanolamine kinase n=1 Tax=Strigamia maritima TaxID=126957 RepID=T1J9W0_STRMM